jgi:hypothetical protein
MDSGKQATSTGAILKTETANEITAHVLEYLELKGYAPIRNATVGIRGRTVKRKHGNPVGSGDILACVNGRWFEFEVKAPGDRMSDAQIERLLKVRRALGEYHIVLSIDHFHELCEKLEI